MLDLLKSDPALLHLVDTVVTELSATLAWPSSPHAGRDHRAFSIVP